MLTQGKWDERETFEYQHASKCYPSPLRCGLLEAVDEDERMADAVSQNL